MEINKASKNIKNKYKKYLFQNGNLFLISKKNIKYNSNIISKKSKNAVISPVIKADAYGMGVLSITSILIELGYKKMFLANIAEGIKLRKKFKNIELFILNIGKPFNVKILKKYNLIPVINSLEEIKIWIKNSTKKDSCILHIDTAMNRLGISYTEILDKKNEVLFNKLNIKYVMTHLACAEDTKNMLNFKQLKEIKKCTKILSKISECSIKSSICNSSGLWLGSKYILDVVRPGAAFWGINPHNTKQNPLKEAVSLYAQITQIKKISKNSSIGYGQTVKMKQDSIIATISIGYSHGFSRLLSNKGSVYIGNKKITILGRVSMDLTVIDISKLKYDEVRTGDLVEIFGPNRSLEKFAKENKTIPYEILCNMGKNIPKIIV
ncbi:MAG: Alanine racemase [Alphaproteobacteria bacterium MarineAlpha9_Bin3]|nr:MAG: Alanine racemase [Alphaproteobacteria bacterium MarineAlpha9_Bin3]|tara:strand:+ start:9818 stop:10957 length:1140 start_codon:yes stop_codon:yes gene_type:complete